MGTDSAGREALGACRWRIVTADPHPTEAIWCNCSKCGSRFDASRTIAFAVKQGTRTQDWRPKVCAACVLDGIKSWPDDGSDPVEPVGGGS